MAADASPKLEKSEPPRRSWRFLLFRIALGLGVALYVLLRLYVQYPQYWPWHCKEGDAFLGDDDCNWCQCKNSLTVCTLMMCSEEQKRSNRFLVGREKAKR